VLAVALIAAGCARPKAAGVQIDPALATLIPADTILAAGARVDALRKTAVFQKYVTSQNFPQLDELGKFTGIDPRKDLWELLFVSDGKHNALLGRGNFASEMETRLERDGAKRYGYKMYYMVGSEQAAVVFFNSSTAAVGDTESLRRIIDARGKSKGPPAPIAERMKEFPADVQIWAAYTGGGRNLLFDFPGNLANLDNFLGTVQSASIYFDLRAGVNGLAKGICGTDMEAKTLHDALKGLIGLGRLSAPASQPDLLRVFDGLEVTQTAAQVNLKIEEPQDLVDKFAELGIRRAR
jgi:hypothetical protein